MASNFSRKSDSSASRTSRGSRPAGKRTSVGAKAKQDALRGSRRAHEAKKEERKLQEAGTRSNKTRGKRSSVAVSARSGKAAQSSATGAEAGNTATQRKTPLSDAIASLGITDTEKADVSSPSAEDQDNLSRIRERRAQRAEREARNRKRYHRYILRIVIVIVTVLVVLFGSIFIYRSDLFHISNVKVEGTAHLTSEEITNLAAVPADSTLFRLDTAGICERLESNAWVQSVSISRQFPDTITINISERTAGAVVMVSQKDIWVVSQDGAWLSAATQDDVDSLVHIIDVSKSLATPVSGRDCDDGGIKNALEIIDCISPALMDQVDTISAESSAKTMLNLKNGVTIAFGDSSDSDLKEADIWKLLETYDGTISYINVRVPSRPTYRTMEEGEDDSSDEDSSESEGD